ncbi:FAD-dependent pyridine nucleotide-disulfide oxidoreductase [Neohortaea acidophila]|uniref:FAD-dependent pyridine nucleotide-disulfide oxidoreductase n=1 Tax=Neohortaea acidophila TaxID=245834 RepID=A0A6A6PFU8_9PEZI|nr:FAD-dependent pyridine nucleotide-disulfide oxidoreductase [Neohortaea acidophila]KAF2478523.1 FAD-dependent pyridine nucleotide-disulfide oxidoreductase [Neohortaea acidophila]
MSTASSVKRFDAIVIGSGQGGTPLASALAQAGKQTALIEKAHIGGCCINEGCTPTKTMVASGRAAYIVSRASDYGVWNLSNPHAGKADDLSASKPDRGWDQIRGVVDMEQVRQRKRDIVESWRGGSEARVKGQKGLELFMGEASFKDANTLTVKLLEGQEVTVAAETIFIDTGDRPARPRLPGLDDVDQTRVLDSTSIMELGAVPDHLVILGGGYIGLEFGQLFRRLGSQVTILQRGKQLAPREDPEIADALRKVLVEDGITVLLNSSATSVKSAHPEEVSVAYKNEQGEEATITGSHLLLAAGRTPNTDMLNLQAAGVKSDASGHIPVDEKLQTNVSHIYAIGDVKGGPAFTHVSYDDFRILRDTLISPSPSQPPRKVSDRVIPYVMYTDPQLAHVGLHESEARKKYPNATIKTASMPMAYVARALETDESRGLMKAVVDDGTKQILGFTCFGIEGGEIMSIVQTAMLGKLPYPVLQDAIFAHPTLAESLNNVWGYLK